SFQRNITLFTLVFINPSVLFILWSKRKGMDQSILFGYISEQVSLILTGIIFSILTQPYPILPFAGIHCDGPLCRSGLPKTDLMFIIAFSIIIGFPPFVFLIMRMHTCTVAQMGSRLKLGDVSQAVIMFLICITLFINWIAFGSFARDCIYYNRMKELHEIIAIHDRGGSHVVFGLPGDMGAFAKEMDIMFVSTLFCLPVPVVLAAHARYLLATSSTPLSERTQRAQARLSKAFFLQV
ncbi:hypothetical protein PFISCL1PPCAC_8403, partial [Pristionchus fissidentatus]